MNGMRDAGEQAPEGRSLEQKSLPPTEPVQSGLRLLSGPRPVLVPNVREFTVDRTAKQRGATGPTGSPAECEKAAFSAPLMPLMNDGGEMDARRNFQTSLASAIENAIQGEGRQPADQKLDAQLGDLLDRRCKEFCSYIEGRLNFFYDQTALRLDALSDQIVKKFCESLSQQAAATLNAVVVASAQQSKSALSVESQHALDLFGRQINELSEAHLEAHRKEVQVLSSNLQLRLRRVAYTLEDVGAAETPEARTYRAGSV